MTLNWIFISPQMLICEIPLLYLNMHIELYHNLKVTCWKENHNIRQGKNTDLMCGSILKSKALLLVKSGNTMNKNLIHNMFE